MTITGYSAERLGRSVMVTATSDLTSPTFYWYGNGRYLGKNTTGEWMITADSGEVIELVAVDSTSSNFDPYDAANIPEHYPNRRILEWTRPTGESLSKFIVEQQQDGGAWSQIASVPSGKQWSYRLQTDTLESGSTYAWRVTAYDSKGNAGTVATWATITQYHRPNPVAFTITYDDGTGLVTYSAS